MYTHRPRARTNLIPRDSLVGEILNISDMSNKGRTSRQINEIRSFETPRVGARPPLLFRVGTFPWLVNAYIDNTDDGPKARAVCRITQPRSIPYESRSGFDTDLDLHLKVAFLGNKNTLKPFSPDEKIENDISICRILSRIRFQTKSSQYFSDRSWFTTQRTSISSVLELILCPRRTTDNPIRKFMRYEYINFCSPANKQNNPIRINAIPSFAKTLHAIQLDIRFTFSVDVQRSSLSVAVFTFPIRSVFRTDFQLFSLTPPAGAGRGGDPRKRNDLIVLRSYNRKPASDVFIIIRHEFLIYVIASVHLFDPYGEPQSSVKDNPELNFDGPVSNKLEISLSLMSKSAFFKINTGDFRLGAQSVYVLRDRGNTGICQHVKVAL
ncbi:hypothetical protein EVAR_44659_1 [Eumeta japonica]|uniref:Uncharacterized protein n=1 Tax=Eumeta variegata TaxID=151549 RepID=A0A4C1XEA4_EUMVA|nr:hypothetical protein EVAR_44659_1 [Eumeta japonica]